MKKHFEAIVKLTSPILLAAILLAVVWVGFGQEALLGVVGVEQSEVRALAWGDYYKSVQEQLAMLISGTEEDGTAIPDRPMTLDGEAVDVTTSVDFTVTLDSEIVTVDATGQGDVPITLDSEQVDAGAATATVTNTTGSGAISVSYAPGSAFWFESVTLNLSAAPTTSENITVTLNAGDGTAYDTILYRDDLSVLGGGTTDLVYQPARDLLCESADAIDVVWLNQDSRTYGLRIIVRLAE